MNYCKIVPIQKKSIIHFAENVGNKGKLWKRHQRDIIQTDKNSIASCVRKTLIYFNILEIELKNV